MCVFFFFFKFCLVLIAEERRLDGIYRSLTTSRYPNSEGGGVGLRGEVGGVLDDRLVRKRLQQLTGEGSGWILKATTISWSCSSKLLCSLSPTYLMITLFPSLCLPLSLSPSAVEKGARPWDVSNPDWLDRQGWVINADRVSVGWMDNLA